MNINLKNVQTIEGLHTTLKNELNFPEFYGMNWAAFWDTITSLVELPSEIIFEEWMNIENTLPEDGKRLKQLFQKFNEQFPEWKCEVVYK